MVGWQDRPLSALLANVGLQDAAERPLVTDGWSGATFSTMEHPDGRRFVLKRTSHERDWIVRATRDDSLREAWAASLGWDGLETLGGEGPRVGTAYLGAAADGPGVAAILMPDLSRELIAWERPGVDPVVDEATLGLVLAALARLHADSRWATSDGADPPPWCPLPERLTLLAPGSAARYAAEGNAVGPRFLAGWEAFADLAPAAATSLIHDLSADVAPLVRALERLPAVDLHGDLKLANVAVFDGGAVRLIDWQMTLRAPVAVELGWFLVSNVAALPLAPAAVLDAYWRALGQVRPDSEPVAGDRDAQMDLTVLVGLLLRGWRKGLDAQAGVTLPFGMSARADLAWWCDRALEAARRRL